MSVLRVIEPFATDVDGVPRVFRAGDLVHSSDKVVKGRSQFFAKVEDVASRTSGAVETASAAPGERRSRSAAKKSAKRAQKRAAAANPTGADDGQKDPESGSNQVPGVNRKGGSPAKKTTAAQRRSEKAAKAKAEAENPTGADDGQPDPESGPSQIPGPNDDPSATLPAEGSGSADDGTGGPGSDED